MLNDIALDTLFYAARTHQGWLDREVTVTQLEHLFDMLKWAPTAFNSSPARLVFVKSQEQKQKLAGCALAANAAKILQAPVTVIVGMDMEFYDKLTQLAPYIDGKAFFGGN